MELKFSENLNKLIKKTGKNVKFLAEDIGVPYATLHSYTIGYNCRSSFNAINAKKISEYFEVSLDELLFSKESKNSEKVKQLKDLINSLEI